MVSIYEIKNGFLGAVDEVADRAPAPAGWTFTAPPKMARGKAAKWAGDGWVLVPASEADAAMEAAQAAARARQLEAVLSGVDAERDARIARGKPHTFPDGTTGTVQLRHERDSVNINAVATAGTALVAAGSDGTVAFRDAEDVTHTLTGAEAVQFGLAVMQWVSAHYAAAWAHKDAIRLLAHGTDLAALADYDIQTGWPQAQGEEATP